MENKRVLPSVLFELTIWLCIVLFFLHFYVNKHYSSPNVILPHLRLVFDLILATIILRISVFNLFKNHALFKAASTFIFTSLLLSLLTYYVLVLTSLQSWGKVISIELIHAYLAELPELTKTLGFSITTIVCISISISLSVLALVHLFLAKFDWIELGLSELKIWQVTGLILAGLTLLASEAYRFSNATPVQIAEPFTLTVFSKEAKKLMQNHSVDLFDSVTRDRKEDEARKIYRINSTAERKNLILIVADALRADHLSLYGYKRNTSPYLQTLEQSGMLRKVSGVRASCGESTCGLLSLASSKYVHQLPSRPITLQEVLKLHDYRIHMILSGDHTNFYDLKNYYGTVDSYFDGSHSKQFSMNDDFLVLERASNLPAWDAHPVMMQFHLMSTHALGKRHQMASSFGPSENYYGLRVSINDNREKIIETARNYYDNGVMQMDFMVAALLKSLKEKGYLENTLVVITADHGEALGEHDIFSHSNGVYDELLRIPVLLLSYGYKGQPLESHGTASQVDIAPTILKEFHMAQPASWVGIPLQVPSSRNFTYFQQGVRKGLIDHRNESGVWKYWIDTRRSKEYLFDLSADPNEKNNLVHTVEKNYLQELRRELNNVYRHH